MADIIAGIFLLMAIITLIAGLVGLVKPSLVKQDRRGKAFGKGMAAFLVFLVAFIIAIPKDESPKQEAAETASKEPLISRQAEKANKATNETQKEEQGQSFTSKLTVSDYAYTMRNQPAISIHLIKTDEEFIDLTIIKSEINKGFKSKLGKADINNWENDKFDISLHLDGVYFKNLPSKNQSNYIEFSILEYNKAKRQAKFEISFELTNTKDNKQVADINKLAFMIDGDNFDLLKKDFSTAPNNDEVEITEPVKAITLQEKTISRKNIEAVIASLKKHYNVDAWNSDYETGLDMEKVCWNDRACEVFAKTVQIQATHRSVEALTSSRVTPQYYQEVCSAIMIALTGANKALIEQQIPQFFNYASQNGRSKWEMLGIEITVSPDSSGLLGCDFYKPK